MSLFTPEMRLNPFPMYAQMRRHQPVTYLEPLGTWAVFGYDHVKTVFSDYTRFSSQISHLFSDPEKGVSLVFSDPPKHTMLRALVSKAFTAAAIARMEPRITALTHELLDKVAAGGRLDVVNDLSTPLPVIVIAEMLGAPTQDREQFKVWSNAEAELFNAVVSGNVPGHLIQADLELEGYIKQLAEQRRKAPKEDLISALVAAEVEGEKLSEGDLIQFVKLLLVAGNETTTTLIGNAVLTLLEHPDQLALLRENPALISSAIEEVLRFRSPVQAQFRLATQDLELGGQAIKAGDKVAAFLGSANRDEAKFANPDRFDILRDPNHHVSFGHGIHFCLGAPLARLETKVALTALLQRFGSWERADNEPLQMVPGLVMWGLSTLPIRVTTT
ncbi:MAG TPA: cytochrome P450 [Symbiobacteriaceae bacterium]|nr:cytochrome P450 [Symbiobacteriaceae bacterium]